MKSLIFPTAIIAPRWRAFQRSTMRVGSNWSIRTKLLFNAILALLLMLSMLLVIYNSARQSYQQEQWVNHAYQVVNTADHLLLHLITMQTSARGFLLTGEQQLLTPYYQALDDYDRSFQELRGLVSDNAFQSERLAVIDRAARDWRTLVIERALQFHADSHVGRAASPAAVELISGGASRFESIRDQLESFRDFERGLLAQRTDQSQASATFLSRIMLVGVPFTALLCLFVSMVIGGGIAQRVEQIARAADRMETDQFDDSVELPVGNDEVGRTARAFQRMSDTIREQMVAQQMTEELLRERELRFRLLAEHATDMIARYSPDGVFKYVSPASESMLGYQPERLIGRSLYEFFHPDDLPVVQACHESLLREATTQTVAYRLRAASGAYVWVETTSHAIRDADTGEVTELQAASRDITRRKQIEDALAQQHAFFRQVVSAMGQGLTVTDSAGRFEFVNDAYARMLGVDPAALVGQTPRDVTFGEDLDTLSHAQAQRMRGAVSTYETRLRRTDGSAVYALVTGVPREQDGAIAGSIAVITDLTERRQIEEALRRERDFTSIVLDTISSLVIVLDRQGRIVQFNRACENLTGYRFAEVQGRPFWDLFVPADEYAPVKAVFDQLTAGHFPNQHENDWLTRRGDRRRIAWFNMAILDEGGEPEFIIGTGSDITDRKNAEVKLESYNAELSSKVAELQRQTGELVQLNEMSDLLQACRTVDEAYGVIVNVMRDLFAGDSGSLAIFKASQNFLEVVASWGGAQNDAVFRPDDCWGVRRGRLHLAQADGGIRCAHVGEHESSGYLCAPMMASGESLGVLHIRHGESSPFPESKQRLAQAVAGQLELALASLRLQETLRNQSIRDSLTGLFNRRYMEESLEREVQRAIRNSYPLAVLMLDVDHFKRFNDTFGHDAGDALLREVGLLLQAHTRGDDIACRYGGEEFTIVLVNVSPEVALQRAEELRQAVRRLQVQHLRQSLGPISISAGVAYCPHHGQEVSLLLRQADAALYRAKHEGRDRVVVAS